MRNLGELGRLAKDVDDSCIDVISKDSRRRRSWVAVVLRAFGLVVMGELSETGALSSHVALKHLRMCLSTTP